MDPGPTSYSHGCLRPDVRAALQIYEAKIGATWSRLPFGLAGHRYRILRINGDELGATNPFGLLASGIPSARSDMASQAIVVAGARFRDGKPGFYVLTDHSEGGHAVSGERLLDYSCAVLLSQH